LKDTVCVAVAPVFEFIQIHLMSDVSEPPVDRLTYALSILVGDPCLQIGQGVYAACKDIKFIHSGDESSASVYDASLSTWLCDEACFFTLIKTDAHTLVYSHTNHVLYYATPQAQLAAACPVDTAVLCQFTVDSLSGEFTPRLLAFDILSHRGGDPAARGETLRALAVHLPGPLCCVQWVGPRLYLTSQFVAGLPHRANGAFVLTSDPLIVRPVSSI
jgi:hypothetical protein